MADNACTCAERNAQEGRQQYEHANPVRSYRAMPRTLQREPTAYYTREAMAMQAWLSYPAVELQLKELSQASNLANILDNAACMLLVAALTFNATADSESFESMKTTGTVKMAASFSSTGTAH